MITQKSTRIICLFSKNWEAKYQKNFKFVKSKFCLHVFFNKNQDKLFKMKPSRPIRSRHLLCDYLLRDSYV